MSDERYSRQGFLGEGCQLKIAECVVGIAGLGGGGSHIAQQLAHLGFKKFRLFDPDIIEDSNLNRTVGATEADIEARTSKVDIASRLITGVQPNAEISKSKSPWQDVASKLNGCDILFTCLDGFDERRQIEAQARRYLIPLIDIGLGVVRSRDEPPYMAGQVILSMPGYACLTCMSFLNERAFELEAGEYGAAGPRPQVVWANGVLASTAVGLGVDLITDWTRSIRGPAYLDYRANTGLIQFHDRLKYVPEKCKHFDLKTVGPVQVKFL